MKMHLGTLRYIPLSMIRFFRVSFMLHFTRFYVPLNLDTTRTFNESLTVLFSW